MKTLHGYFAATCSAAVLCSILILLAPARAEDAGGGFGPGRPPTNCPIHWWDDFGFLKDKEQQTDLFDPVKFIPLDDSNQRYFSVGLEYRERYESWSNSAFGQGPSHDPNGYELSRVLLRGDLRLKPHFRIYTELKSVYESGREGAIRPFDQDAVDVLAAFVEAGTDLGDGKSIDFRIGRQELHYGSGRLIEIVDSLNNRQSFDAAKMMLNLGKWQVDTFYSRPVNNEIGAFDDKSSKHYSLAGIYAVCRNLPLLTGAGLDAYVLRNDVDNALFFKGIEDEHRTTIGSRLYGSFKSFSYDVEPDLQVGQYDGNTIRAWASSNDIGYTFAKAPAAPKLDLHFDAFSGDRGHDEKSLGTFNSLFPNGEYYSEPSPIGKQNMVDLRPAVEWHPHKDITLTTANIWYWRQSIHDGTYFYNGSPMVPPINKDRFIGSETVVNLEWRAQKHVSINTAYSHFIVGDFLRNSPHGKNFDFLAAWMTFRF